MEGRVEALPSRLPAAVLLGWAAATLLWWAVAFAPLPGETPPWLTAARAACFGTLESGWPGPEGWIMLTLAPVSLLGVMAVLWGREVGASLRRLVREATGRWLVGAVLGLALLEGTWVVGKVRTALVVTARDDAGATGTALPAGYPRRPGPAADFSLVDQHGLRVSLAGLRGRPVVLAFVFAHCQTLCPLVVSSVVEGVPGSGGRALLVTLDPWRDTPRVLPSVARRWRLPPEVHLLSSGSPEEVLAVVQAYGVPFERSETTGDITHPGLVYLIDAQGRMAYAFNAPSAAWIREGLRRLGGMDGRLG